MRPLYIFDLDGTLALTEHRQHHVAGATKDWRTFFAACKDDPPNMPVIQTMNLLAGAGAEVRVWSGRSDEVRSVTVQWLSHFTSLTREALSDALRMRAEHDYTPDEILKARWFEELPSGDRMRLVAIFDDRAKVVSMWRAAGVPCFQVAPGNF